MAYADTRWIRIDLAQLRPSLGDKMANLAAAALAVSEAAARGGRTRRIPGTVGVVVVGGDAGLPTLES
jgi:hypothetical protein